MAYRRLGSMAAVRRKVVIKRKDILFDGCDQLVMIAARQVGPADRPVEQAIACKDSLLSVLDEHNMAKSVARTMADLEFEIPDGERLAVLDISRNTRRIVVIESHRGKLMRRKTHRQRLLRQGVIQRPFVLMDKYLGIRKFLVHKTGSTNMVEMPMRETDRGKLKAIAPDKFSNRRGPFAGIDTDRLAGLFACDDASVLLKWCLYKLFDQHWFVLLLRNSFLQ